MTYEAFNKERASKADLSCHMGVNEEDMLLKLPGVPQDSVNSCVLRNSEVFDVDPTIFSQTGMVTKKNKVLAAHVMLIRASMPTFSGNIKEYLINQLMELDLLANSKNKVLPVSNQVPNQAPTSTIFPYLQSLLKQAKE